MGDRKPRTELYIYTVYIYTFIFAYDHPKSPKSKIQNLNPNRKSLQLGLGKFWILDVGFGFWIWRGGAGGCTPGNSVTVVQRSEHHAQTLLGKFLTRNSQAKRWLQCITSRIRCALLNAWKSSKGSSVGAADSADRARRAAARKQWEGLHSLCLIAPILLLLLFAMVTQRCSSQGWLF